MTVNHNRVLHLHDLKDYFSPVLLVVRIQLGIIVFLFFLFKRNVSIGTSLADHAIQDKLLDEVWWVLVVLTAEFLDIAHWATFPVGEVATELRYLVKRVIPFILTL